MLRSGAVAAGLVWTTPAIRSARLVAAPGTPPPTSTTTSSSSTPPSPVTFTPAAACTPTLGGSFDLELIFDGLDAGAAATLDIEYLTGELAPGSATLHGIADSGGRVTFTIAHTFLVAWSALITLTDASSEVLVAGLLNVPRRCRPGEFTPA
jgi:hypothetical protein